MGGLYEEINIHRHARLAPAFTPPFPTLPLHDVQQTATSASASSIVHRAINRKDAVSLGS